MRTLHDLAEQHQPKHGLDGARKQLEGIVAELLDFGRPDGKGLAQIGSDRSTMSVSAMGSSRPSHLADTAITCTRFLGQGRRTGQCGKYVIERRMWPDPRLQFTWGADRYETTVAQDGDPLAELFDFLHVVAGYQDGRAETLSQASHVIQNRSARHRVQSQPLARP